MSSRTENSAETKVKIPRQGFVTDGRRRWVTEVAGEEVQFRRLYWRDINELNQIVELQDQVWQMGDKNLVPENLLAIVEEVGGDVLSAGKPGSAPDGFVLTVPTANPERLFLHMVGVNPESQSRGLGEKLMLLEGTLARDRGIKRIDWTYDPLMGANANLYLAHLGTVPHKYTINKYGILVNSTDPNIEPRYKKVETDRFTVRWDIGNDGLWQKIMSGENFTADLSGESEWNGEGAVPDRFRVSLPRDFASMTREGMIDTRNYLRQIALRAMSYEDISNRGSVEGTHEVTGFGSDPDSNANYYVFESRQDLVK